MTEHWSLALQVAADTTRAYGEFPLIGARAAVWIAAEVHLMFAAFVLGVPMFAVVAEAIGIFGKDQRYDRPAKEFTRLLLVGDRTTATWGPVQVLFLGTPLPTRRGCRSPCTDGSPTWCSAARSSPHTRATASSPPRPTRSAPTTTGWVTSATSSPSRP